MNELFTYHKLNVFLIPTSKTLSVEIKNTEENYFIDQELLFELESVLAWAFDKIEITSILISKENNAVFSNGFHFEKINQKNKEYWIKTHQRIYELNKLILKLPQTVILDLGLGASNCGMELCLAADIKMGHKLGSLDFNFLTLGISPQISHLMWQQHLGIAKGQQWILGQQKVSHLELQHLGFFLALYDDTNCEDVLSNLIQQIGQQLPVTRIQTKLAINRATLQFLEQQISGDAKILQGTLVAEEWKMMPLKNSKMQKNAMLHELEKINSTEPVNDQRLKKTSAKILTFPN